MAISQICGRQKLKDSRSLAKCSMKKHIPDSSNQIAENQKFFLKKVLKASTGKQHITYEEITI